MDKHPRDPDPGALGRVPAPNAFWSWQVTPAEVFEAGRTFPAGSAGGPDGFRPGHLAHLVGFGGNSEQLVSALADFINLLLHNDCRQEVRSILFGGNMIALFKDKEGLRPKLDGFMNLNRILSISCNRIS